MREIGRYLFISVLSFGGAFLTYRLYQMVPVDWKFFTTFMGASVTMMVLALMTTNRS